MRSKRTPNLHNLIQRRLSKLTLLTPLRLTDLTDDECETRMRAEGAEGTCADFIEGIRLNETVDIFLDAWGFPGPDPRRYTFIVFARPQKRWCLVQGHIEEINYRLDASRGKLDARLLELFTGDAPALAAKIDAAAQTDPSRLLTAPADPGPSKKRRRA